MRVLCCVFLLLVAGCGSSQSIGRDGSHHGSFEYGDLVLDGTLPWATGPASIVKSQGSWQQMESGDWQLSVADGDDLAYVVMAVPWGGFDPKVLHESNYWICFEGLTGSVDSGSAFMGILDILTTGDDAYRTAVWRWSEYGQRETLLSGYSFSDGSPVWGADMPPSPRLTSAFVGDGSSFYFSFAVHGAGGSATFANHQRMVYWNKVGLH